MSPKTDWVKLADWEILLIQIAVRQLVDAGKAHPKHGKELVDKLEKVSTIQIYIKEVS